MKRKKPTTRQARYDAKNAAADICIAQVRVPRHRKPELFRITAKWRAEHLEKLKREGYERI